MAFEEWLKQPTPVTFVHRPTLFRRGQEKCFLVGFINSLIIQNYIRQPYMLRWHVKCVYTAVVIWIPFELVVVPLLGKNKQSLWWEFEKKFFLAIAFDKPFVWNIKTIRFDAEKIFQFERKPPWEKTISKTMLLTNSLWHRKIQLKGKRKTR